MASCLNCEEGKLNEYNRCERCEMVLCSKCEDRMCRDKEEPYICEYCVDDYCLSCFTYLSEGCCNLCRDCLERAAEEFIEKNNL